MSYLRASGRCFTALAVLTFACTITPGAPGLKLHSELVKNRHILGEPIYLTVVLENTGESAITIPGGVMSRFLTVRVVYEGGFASYHGPTMSITHVVSTKKEFAGGAKDTRTYELTSMYPLWTAGRYEVEAVFAGNRDEYLDGRGNIVEDADTIWAGEIKAPVLVIELQEPRGVDREALEFLKPRISGLYGNKDIDVYRRVFSYRYYHFVRELRDKYPASLYTAYALCTKHRIDLSKAMSENPKPPEEVLRSFEETRLNPPNEYYRSVQPKEREELLKDLWLVVKHHPEFTFIDRVYEVMGYAHLSEGNYVQAQGMFEKAAGATKDAKRKERMGAFMEAMKGRAGKPERAAEQPKAPAEKQPE